jgi:LPS export ABC transporter protein LptC
MNEIGSCDRKAALQQRASNGLVGFFLPAVYLMFILATQWGCENNEKDLPNFRVRQISVDTGRVIEAYMSENSIVKAKLTSPYMLRTEMDSPFVEFPRSLHVDFYNDSLVIESQLDARYGKYKELDNKVLLRDSVVVKNIAKGDTLITPELWWDQKAEKFYTDKPVHILKKGGTDIHGIGFEAPQDFNSYTIYKIIGPYGFKESSIPK